MQFYAMKSYYVLVEYSIMMCKVFTIIWTCHLRCTMCIQVVVTVWWIIDRAVFFFLAEVKQSRMATSGGVIDKCSVKGTIRGIQCMLVIIYVITILMSVPCGSKSCCWFVDIPASVIWYDSLSVSLHTLPVSPTVVALPPPFLSSPFFFLLTPLFSRLLDSRELLNQGRSCVRCDKRPFQD